MSGNELLERATSSIHSIGRWFTLTVFGAIAVYFIGSALLVQSLDSEVRELVELREEAGERAIADYEAAVRDDMNASVKAQDGWGEGALGETFTSDEEMNEQSAGDIMDRGDDDWGYQSR